MKTTENERLDQLLSALKSRTPQPDIDAWLTEDESEAYDRIVGMHVRRRRIVRWAAAAVLVGIVVTIGLQVSGDEGETAGRSTPRIAKVPAAVACPSSEPSQPPSHPLRERISPTTPPLGEVGRGLLPDTLGDALWQREENVLLALEMLEECEATIQRGEQTVRNDIIEATYRATPQPAHAILVSNEAGDSEVIELPTTIEI